MLVMSFPQFKGNPAVQLLKTMIHQTTTPSRETGEETTTSIPELEPPVTQFKQPVNRQFLVVVPQDPPVSDELNKHEHNLAGKSILPKHHPGGLAVSADDRS